MTKSTQVQSDKYDSMSKSVQVESDRFSEPSPHSMSRSTDEPFILHGKGSKSGKGGEKNKSQGSDATKQSRKSGGIVRTNSNGFLSSSQLSRKKVGSQLLVEVK